MGQSVVDSAWPTLAKVASVDRMRVNVGQAKTELSKLLARVEAGEEIEIARNGVPVARLVKVEREMSPGERWLSTWGALEGRIWVSEDFEFSEQELEQMYREIDEDWEEQDPPR